MKSSLLQDQEMTKCSEVLVYSRDSKNMREVFVLSNLGEILVIKWTYKVIELEKMLNLSQSECTLNITDTNETQNNTIPSSTSNTNCRFKKTTYDKKGVITMVVDKVNVNGNRQTNLKLKDKKAMLNLVQLLYGKKIYFRFKGEFILGVSMIEGVSSLLVGNFCKKY
jgi:hypothetical protein